MNENVKAPKTLTPEPKSFIGLPVCTNWAELRADAVLFGVPHGNLILKKIFQMTKAEHHLLYDLLPIGLWLVPIL